MRESKSRWAWIWLRKLIWLLAAMVFGVVIAVFAGAVLYLDSRTDLDVWHTVRLTEEFTTDTPITRFEDYLALENRLFKELDAKVYDAVTGDDSCLVLRYCRGSLADPGRWPTNWNRSFELGPASPAIGVLLIHGMSDSPYSMRRTGQQLAAAGARVLGLRVPGHGTVPSGLVRTTWEDMAAAVTLAMGHLKKAMGDRPIYIVGYSNGAALALNYTLTALTDEALPRVSGVVLMSPQIAVTRAAALARWQAQLGRFLALPKLLWNDLSPEYDPFKYGSFAVNAGEQSHRITGENRRLISRRGAEGALGRMPPILAFQSVVDATILAPALVTDLFDQLPEGGHELVLFDVNRPGTHTVLMKPRSGEPLVSLIDGPKSNFTIALITNSSASSLDVVERRLTPDGSGITVKPLGLAWPKELYSLSHVALPFPPDDPVYGGDPTAKSPGIQLGAAPAYGERGVLNFSPGALLRIRWNPFYGYMSNRIHQFMGLAGNDAAIEASQ